MAVPLEQISSNPYFAGLSDAELGDISKYLFEKGAERGQVLLFEGDPAGHLYFVVSGAVKVYKTSAEGKEQILQIIRPGESFNDVPLLGGGVNLASAEALGKASLYTINKSDLEKIIQGYPQVALNAVNILSRQVQQLMSLVEDLSFKHVTGRVAKILLENLANPSGPVPRLTQQEMAAMAGTAREMVGRALKSLEEEGVIRLDRYRIIITDKEALKALAGIME